MNNNIWFGVMVVSLIFLIACLSPLLAWGTNSVEFSEDNIETMIMIMVALLAISAVGLYASATKYQWRSDPEAELKYVIPEPSSRGAPTPGTRASVAYEFGFKGPQSDYNPEYAQLELTPKSYGYASTSRLPPPPPAITASEQYTNLPPPLSPPPPPISGNTRIEPGFRKPPPGSQPIPQYAPKK